MRATRRISGGMLRASASGAVEDEAGAGDPVTGPGREAVVRTAAENSPAHHPVQARVDR